MSFKKEMMCISKHDFFILLCLETSVACIRYVPVYLILSRTHAIRGSFPWCALWQALHYRWRCWIWLLQQPVRSDILVPPCHDWSRVVDMAESGFGEEAEGSGGYDYFPKYAAESEWDAGGCVECRICGDEEHYGGGRDEYDRPAVSLCVCVDARYWIHIRFSSFGITHLPPHPNTPSNVMRDATIRKKLTCEMMMYLVTSQFVAESGDVMLYATTALGGNVIVKIALYLMTRKTAFL